MANEVVLNALLWDILKEGGIIDSQAEERNADGSKTDIRCAIGDCVVAVEAEHGDSSVKKKSANQDADDKLRRRVCDLAIALVYPPQCNTRDDLLHSDLLVNVRTPDYQPKPKQTKWTAVKGAAMANFIQHAPNELGSPETLAKKANIAINSAAARFTETQSESIMAEMGEAASGTNIKGLMTDLLTAIMFHTKLDTIRHQTPPLIDDRQSPATLPYEDKWPPQSVSECKADGNQVVKAFHTAHDQWLAMDYKHILEWSCAILHALPKSPNSNAAVKIIADAAIEIQSASGKQHHDLVGITFCQSVETAKSDGSMYTTIPAATLLTHLLFHKSKINWKNIEEVTRLRIVDFACGTGTLLIAAANYILHREKTGQPEKVAQALLEQMLYGFDVYNRAIFQTATGLGMIAPSIAFHNMHLYSLTLGIDPEDDKAKLGSLEMLQELKQPSFNPRPPTGTRIDAEPAPIEVDKFHMAIMNPPFTANSKRHHHLQKEVKDALHLREQELYEGTDIQHTSNSSGFLVLAEKYLDANGRIAVVLPTAFSTGASALDLRIYLAEKFHIQYIIISYDPKRIFHSGNTSIGEMLVVLERKRKGKTPPSNVIKLTTNPDTASGAAACASSILEGKIKEHQWGIVDRISPKEMAAGNWNAVQFTDNELYRIASTELWKTTLANQVEITTIGRRIHEHCRKCHPNAIYATPTLYDHNVKHCDRLEVEPDAHVHPQPDNTRAMKYLIQLHSLKLPSRINLPTVKNMACRTTIPTVSAAWQSGVPANGGDHNTVAVEKAIVIILNSTPGKLGMLLVRTFKKPPYPNYGIEGLLRVPCPWLADLKPEQMDGLVKAYDALRNEERLSLPQAHKCPVQIAIDEAVCQHLNFDKKLCLKARHLLAQEPMVTGKRYQFNQPPQSALL